MSFPSSFCDHLAAVFCLSLDETLKTLYNALAFGGFLIIEEMLPMLPIFLFGFDSEMWTNMHDGREVRWLSEQEWENRVVEAGFSVVMCFVLFTLLSFVFVLNRFENYRD